MGPTVAPEFDRPCVCIISYHEGTVIEESEEDRGRRGRRRQVEGVAGKVRGDNARTKWLVHRGNGAGSGTRAVGHTAASLGGAAGSQGEIDSPASDGYRTIFEQNAR